MRTTARRLLLLLVALPAPLAAQAKEPEYDPGYERVLEAYKAERWEDFDRLAPAFLEEKPGYRFAHSVRYMIAASLRQRQRLVESAAAFRTYLAKHPEAGRADQARSSLIQVLNEDRRHEEALAEAERYLEESKARKYVERVTYERAYALESLRRFDEAAASYREIHGRYEELASYRLGVALFRGRRFSAARKALLAFLEHHPESSHRGSVEDYLFRTETGFERIVDGIVLDYRGKYEDDPRLERIRETLTKRRAASLAEIERRIDRKVPRSFLIRLADAGTDRSGNFASTRLEVVRGEPRQVVILFTEYLVTGVHDLDRTLIHELYHCLQRESLGEDHFRAPKWVREGTALYVAGQGPARTRFLAAERGRRSEEKDPVSALVNGLSGRHTLDDYAEDVAAFEAAEARHGRTKTVRLLRELLVTPDAEAAVAKVLREDLATFERAAAARARESLMPLLAEGREAILAAQARFERGEWKELLDALPSDAGAYAPVAAFYRGRALLQLSRPVEALRAIRDGYLARHRTFATMTDNVLYDEVRALEAAGSEEFEAALARARKDLEPTGVYPALTKRYGE